MVRRPDNRPPNVPAADGTTTVLAVDSETSKANEWHTEVVRVEAGAVVLAAGGCAF
ncbi:hypothetical protein [Streptomyces sp. NPDC002889]|uniref:hypothetical protein n=1 Tax=Streptomyces sp. NPDC002889 TaxID=3364669 RepID=UPI00368566DC